MGDFRSNNADISTFALRLGISLSMIKLICGNRLWLVLVLLFGLCVVAVQPAKPVWVDECYTYYGVSHDSFDEFWRSMCCGVNFAPPLYFFLNWLLQLVLPSSIEILRLESLVVISVAVTLTFVACKRHWGTMPSVIGCFTILSQSELLFTQAFEARHYAMFAFASALVLITFPPCGRFNSRLRAASHFAAHIALNLIHYVGIVFSILSACSRFWINRENGIKSIPVPEIASWLCSIPIYVILLSDQSSHLGEWDRPNDIEALLEMFLDSFSPLTLVIPVAACLLYTKANTLRSLRNHRLNIVLLSVFWIVTPILFWLLSHVSSLNLFKDRYFIPKELALMVLLSFCIHKLMEIRINRTQLKTHFLPVCACMLCTIPILLLSVKRKLFAYDPSRNYYHSLIEKSPHKSDRTKVYFGDHIYFPNLISNKAEDIGLLHLPADLIEVYNDFSKCVRSVQTEELMLLDKFLVAGDKQAGTKNLFTDHKQRILPQSIRNSSILYFEYSRTE